MFVEQIEPQIAVGATEGTVFIVEGTAAQIRRIEIVNLDGANTLTWRYQSSNDGASWTDVDPDDTLAPGLTQVNSLSGAVFYRLRASGSLNLAVRITSSKTFTGQTFITR